MINMHVADLVEALTVLQTLVFPFKNKKYAYSIWGLAALYVVVRLVTAWMGRSKIG